MLVYGILCLSPAVLMLFEDLEIDSVQHVDCDDAECNHNEVESYVVSGGQ